ncbi:MAG: LrgB family protein [Hydrogenophaga sp.]|uniref:LrgB family protein n=1 Tax=Hydrogenophaga sp. TaxID=1904254 RepID=UPI0027281850|nr:LrgB family protein [Hydrogenophaga sp.]MDO9478980.1 LrgB family protein [Hydrogenophaga sp.]MDO9568690.1 LrgB family protein [Hydrogenophaga sp.]MDP2219126.1 LrgB family protein [Hydrogenophaga sp.]MDP3342921.1 LrgB family protein [Hydrogenophaga sp.]MDP3376215.1 LrgB family protein [Hydrogenophaga sp.]
MNPVLPAAAERLADVWVYLATTPLLGLTVTLLVYQGAFMLYQRSGFHPLANPVAMAVVALGTLLWATGTPYATYFEGAQFVHFLLGPATVALAAPLFEQLPRLKRLWLPMLGALVVGTLAATVTAIGVGWALGASKATLASLAPKSVTTPVAMGIAEKMGGLPSLTAVLVVCTGIVGAASARFLFDALRITDPTVRGFALGTAAHGIGTARAFQVSQEMGAFAGLAMGLSALFSALALPLVAGLLLRWV